MNKWICYFRKNGTVEKSIVEECNYPEVESALIQEMDINVKDILGAYPEGIDEYFSCHVASSPEDLFGLIKAGKLKWFDPDPIPGNDYRVNFLVIDDSGDTGIIKYNHHQSIADLFLSELSTL